MTAEILLSSTHQAEFMGGLWLCLLRQCGSFSKLYQGTLYGLGAVLTIPVLSRIILLTPYQMKSLMNRLGLL